MFFVSSLTKPTFDTATVPDGEAWLVKSMYCHNSSTSPSQILFDVRRTPDAIQLFLHSQVLAAAGLAFWEGWIVLEAGDATSCYAEQAGVAFIVSGTRLPISI